MSNASNHRMESFAYQIIIMNGVSTSWQKSSSIKRYLPIKLYIYPALYLSFWYCVLVYTYYYRWYGELFLKTTDECWEPGPVSLSFGKRLTSKLLKLKWDGYPLYYHEKHGWGYVVPGAYMRKFVFYFHHPPLIMGMFDLNWLVFIYVCLVYNNAFLLI